MKIISKILVLVLILALSVAILSSCSSGGTKYTGQCLGCDGHGIISWYDANHKLQSKVCPRCHGTGRSN